MPHSLISLFRTYAPLAERSHVFEDRHWVDEACGDDLWDL